jgi:hypothetical protein
MIIMTGLSPRGECLEPREKCMLVSCIVYDMSVSGIELVLIGRRYSPPPKRE